MASECCTIVVESAVRGGVIAAFLNTLRSVAKNIRPRAHVNSFVRALLARWREKPILADSRKREREREREISIYAIESFLLVFNLGYVSALNLWLNIFLFLRLMGKKKIKKWNICVSLYEYCFVRCLNEKNMESLDMISFSCYTFL